MKNYTSKYPIGSLILKSIALSGMRPASFLREIGYSNVDKALRRLDNVVKTGCSDATLIERIMNSPFKPSLEELNEAMSLTQTLLQEEKSRAALADASEARKRFRPYLIPITENKVPASITIFAALGGFERLHIALPASFADWPVQLQYTYARHKIRTNYRGCHGYAPLLGEIVGYRLFRQFDAPPLHLTIDGQPLGLGDSCDREPSVSLSLSHSRKNFKFPAIIGKRRNK
jgi:hypothetical protein